MRRIVPAAEGMAAMQAINQSAVRPLFMTALFGTALGCLGLIDGEMSTRDQPTFGWLVAGAGLFLVGAIVVTIGRNVPMNDSLAALGPTDPDAADHWKCYLASWAMWNHVRTIASLAAAGLLTTALVRS
ncbi:MAG: DUF1772 domain-containing protein [Geodermatophilaceae bacterium]|nr:DUF1772 domain-containing protein [Geodermatophilaceae bacterium]